MSKLTDRAIKNAKPKVGRYELSDNGSAFRLVVQPSGHKSYAVRPWFNGKQIKVTLGDEADLSLAEARALAAGAVRDAGNGIDPRQAKRDAKTKRQLAEASSFASVAQLYLGSERARGLRSAKWVRDKLERLVLPKIGDRPIADIRRSHYVAVLDHIEKHSGPVMADRTLSAIWQVLKFHARRSDDYVIPLIPGMNRTSPKARARDRVLSDDEIRKVWACGNVFVRFLLHSAARRDEAAGMRWCELKGNIWTLPGRRNKTKVDLVRPLSKAAMALLPPRGADDEYIFGLTPDRPLRSYNMLVKRAHAASGTSGWTLHDLRRTARSLMSRAGVNTDHAERCLGHVIGGVRGVYDRHEYQAEKAHALEALAHQIKLIVDPPKGNVSQLRRA